MGDGAEGWVTVRGNAGSTYAEESGRQFVVCRAIPLQSEFSSDGGEIVRMLAEEEVIEVLEGPQEEEAEALMRVRTRAIDDGKSGWVTLRGDNLLPWSPNYRCASATAIHDALTTEGAA